MRSRVLYVDREQNDSELGSRNETLVAVSLFRSLSPSLLYDAVHLQPAQRLPASVVVRCHLALGLDRILQQSVCRGVRSATS